VPTPLSTRLAAFAAIAGGVALGVGAPARRLPLLPLVQKTFPIADSVFGGASRCRLQAADTGIRFTFELRPGVAYPWAGINLRLADSSQTPVDASAWQAIEVRAETSPRRALRLQLLSDDQNPSRGARDPVSLIYHALEFQPDGSLQRLDWPAFSVPSWWRTERDRPDQQRLDLLDRLRSIEFQNGYLPDQSPTPTSVTIRALDLVGPNRPLQATGLLVALGGLSALVWSFRRLPKSSPSPVPTTEKPLHPLDPTPVVVDDPRSRQRDQIVAALRQGFSDPELGLDSFAASQGLSPRLVATLLKEATGLHFKGALNELRLVEAARLLRESKANVSEIGYAVGFQNASHFGRAFRERFGTSPSDYRTSPPAA